jgi:excinuclease ABC subunit C
LTPDDGMSDETNDQPNAPERATGDEPAAEEAAEQAEDPLQLKLRRLPHEPGVYRFLGKGNRVLYVGKADDLANRVRSYFQPGATLEPHTRSMVRRVEDFTVTVTANPVEALLLESSLIKLHKPRYNINLKDDKRYPFIRLTTEDEFPRIMVTRDTSERASTYFGPFSNAKATRSTLKTLQRLFGLRVCKREIHVWREQGGKQPMPDWRPCLLHGLERCSAPCIGAVSKSEYASYVRAATDFLQGRRGEVAERLKREMGEASQRREYERAAKYRDALRAVEQVMTKQRAVSTKAEDLDILGLARRRGESVVELLKIRQGYLLGDDAFPLEAHPAKSDAAVLAAFLTSYYTGADWIPQRIILPTEPADADDLAKLITRLRNEIGEAPATRALLRASPSTEPTRRTRGGRVRLIVPQRGRLRDLQQSAQRNARRNLEQLLIDQLAKRGQAEAAVQLAERLGLDGVPLVIEGLDISNLGADNPVASLVSFRGGRPFKGGYRHYKLKTPGPDDYAMLAEVTRRRYPKLADKGKLPDLLVVDGGKGQLGAVVEILEAEGLAGRFAVIGLAKKEELVFKPGRKTPVKLPLDSPALQLLQRVRDEAHRFGLRFHRQLRRADGLQSILERVPGIGPARRKALLDTFGSLKGIRKATVEELSAVKGVSEKLAQELLNYLKIHYF